MSEPKKGLWNHERLETHEKSWCYDKRSITGWVDAAQVV
jgi:hypothetical protein